ncbi:BglG family transcription antiterminator [Domibacillus epiphyticus]|uniref:PTS sugar transporter n=1 Tax=Domibacillus epiphyticus TaxID=1714355 RepID=A0A1V2A6H9_9BACI|nr:BglG family transcription antiterminator [Domibacillus epiphyticus]OMP66472.1 PTS sugar transporter [Domibacillus epiphyticus]
MYVSARERLILDLLLDRNEEMTVKELADDIDVSVRTVHRDLKGIEKTLETNGLQLVKKSGVGIQIVGKKEKMDELKLAISHLSYSEYTPDERQTMILCALLESVEPVKLIGLANDLHVTIATVSSDLTKLESRIEPFQLKLVRKRGYGVELKGTETAKRRAMSSIIAEHVNEVDFLAIVKESIQKKSIHATESISERLLGLVEKKKLLVVEQVVKDINAGLPYAIADSAHIGLVVHLALAIERIERGGNIQMEHAYLQHLQAAPEYEIASEMTEKLKAFFQMDIPEAEIGYITMHLQGAKLRHDKEYVLEESSFQVAVKAKSLIQFIEKKLSADLINNQSLFEGLVVHLKPAMYRIHQKMGISNPLIGRIKEDYSYLFNVVKEGVQHVFPNVTVPDEEIGYLVMHFGSALPGAQVSGPLKAYIICSTGIGTSKMLASRLKQEIPELTGLKNISLFELNNTEIDEDDLVISTIHLPDFPYEHIVVSPMLTKDELTKVRSFIKRRAAILSKKKPEKIITKTRSASQIEQSVKSIHHYTGGIMDLLSQFSVTAAGKHQAEQVLKKACGQLTTLRSVDAVVDALLEREKLGGIGIPGTKIAFFHTRHSDVLKPSVTIHRMDEPVVLSGMDEADMKVDVILMLLSPDPYHTEGLEVLSYVSAMTIESDDSIALFQSGQEKEIKEWMASKFELFLNEKINELRSVE